MKRKVLIASTVLISAFSTVLTSTAQANEWNFLPVMDDGYQPHVAVALIGGGTQIDESGSNQSDDDATTYGVELSLDCPLLKPPHHTIRQQVSYVETDEDGLKTSSIELNPHHMFDMNDKLQVGFGPSLGFTKLETATDDDTVFTYGLGASVRYNVTPKLFVGAESRYAWSDDVDLAGVNADYDTLRLLAKVGYQF
jgi:opacity protein-like surface antigen